MTVAPTPYGAGAAVRSGTAQSLLAEDTEVSAPQLVVVDGAEDRNEEVAREPGQVLGDQLRPRLVGRVAVLRVGQHVRVREVRVRTVDQRHVALVDGYRIAGVHDPHGLGRGATRLQADLGALNGGAGNADAQAAAHAERRVLELERRVVREAVARSRVSGRQAEASAVVQFDRGRHEAGPEEVGGLTLERRVDVFRGVGVAGAEQDDRLADLGALTPHVQHEVRRVVRAELTAEDVHAGTATRRGGSGGGEHTHRADATDQGQRRRSGEDLALETHVEFPSWNDSRTLRTAVVAGPRGGPVTARPRRPWSGRERPT